jgi:hypothetical protein
MKTYKTITVKRNIFTIGFTKKDETFKELGKVRVINNNQYIWNFAIFGFFFLRVKPQY